MRKLSDEAKERKSAYDTQYILNNIVQKRIAFNRNIPEDVEMLDWVEQQPNQTQYMKGLISDDMTAKKSGK